MSKQKVRKVLLVQRDHHVAQDAFFLCEGKGCKNAIAAWTIPYSFTNKVMCSLCRQAES